MDAANAKIEIAPVILPCRMRGLFLRAGWWVLVLWFGVCLTLFHYTATTPWHLASPWRMSHFVAATPFQHRVLLPLIVAGFDRIFPDVSPDIVFAVLEIIFWVALIVLARCGTTTFCGHLPIHLVAPLAMTIIVPVAVQLMVPDLTFPSLLTVDAGLVQLGEWHLHDLFRYVYDLPAAVFTLALVLLLGRFARRPSRGRFAAYLAVFALATLNRETAAFMIFAYFGVCRQKLPFMILLETVAVQWLVFGTLLGLIVQLFPGIQNPNAHVLGSLYELHLAFNLAQLASPLYTVIFLARFATGLYIPVLLLHRHLDPILRQTLLWFSPPLLASALIFGLITEQRVFIEIVPIIWLSAIQAISAWNYTKRS